MKTRKARNEPPPPMPRFAANTNNFDIKDIKRKNSIEFNEPPLLMPQFASNIDGLDVKEKSSDEFNEPWPPIAQFSTPNHEAFNTDEPDVIVIKAKNNSDNPDNVDASLSTEDATYSLEI